MIILAVFIVLFVVIYQKRILQQQNKIQQTEYDHQKELFNATIQVEENERERIAKNIHDDLGTLLSVIRLNNINAIKKASDPEAVLKSLEDNKELLNSTSEVVRSISKQLAPPTLLKLGYIEAISELCKHINNTDALTISFSFEDVPTRFDSKIEVQLYRITQEVVNNIIKHAEASDIDIDLSMLDAVLNLSITHNGEGINSAAIEKLLRSAKGLGLKSIQSRVQAINGSIQYLTIGLNDSKIMIHIPLKNEEN